MPSIIHLSTRWEHTLTEILNHDNKTEVGNIMRVTEFRQPLQVQIHLEMPGILVQLGHTQRT